MFACHIVESTSRRARSAATKDALARRCRVTLGSVGNSLADTTANANRVCDSRLREALASWHSSASENCVPKVRLKSHLHFWAIAKARILNDSKHYLAPRGVERRLKTRFSAALSRNFSEAGQLFAQPRANANRVCDSNFRYSIALTGGIATGKSTAAALLKQHGYDIIDADTIAHDVLEQHAARVIAVFGRGICDADSKIDRKKLGAIVFADPEKLRVLESIVHPIIAQTIRDKAALLEQRQKPFFVDIPIFFEKRELFAFVSKSVLVYAPPDVQLARLQARNNLSLKEAQQRIAAQIPIDSKKQQADDIIDNSGDVEALKIQVERYLERLRSAYGL